MLDALSRRLFLTLADSATLRRTVGRYGMRGPRSFARRFIGGRDVDEAIGAARSLEQRGLLHTFNYLGEHVRSLDAAEQATLAYITVIETVRLAGLSCSLSVKLTQLGLEIAPDTCVAGLRRILQAAAGERCFVRVDMESSGLVDPTLEVVETLWREGAHNVGVVLQSALRRADTDLERVNRLGIRVRLVKGAYKEAADVAYPSKRDVDDAFVRLMRVLLAKGTGPAFATHDPRMIDRTCAEATAAHVPPNQFEFQMLYGVRRDLQASLRSQGYAVRVYLPFGADWFPYFMRRLAERPANALFVLRSLLYEQLGDQRTFGGSDRIGPE